MYQAQFGESPAQVRARRIKAAEAEQIREGQAETKRFLEEHPDFPVGPTVKKIVIDEMENRKEAALAQGKTFGFTAHNLEIVYDDLVERGLLVPKQLAPTPVPVTKTDAAVESQITPAPAPQVITPPSALPESTPANDANTPPATSTRPRGTRFATMSTEHGQAPPTAVSQTSDTEFRTMVDNMSLDTLKRRITRDRAFNERLNNIKRA
jgi:hypothetical protein